MERAEQNIQDGISLVQTAEAALGKISDPHLLRLRELVIQAANDTLTDGDRLQIQLEIDQLKDGINHIANHTEFNTIKLLNRVSNEGEPPGITIVNGSEIALTSDPNYDTQPSWQGDHIAFNRGNDIFIMNSDGTDQKLLISGASQPALSPDASKIAYIRNDNNLYIANIDGTGEVRLTTTSDLKYDPTFGSRLTWSPNNQEVYFTSGNGIESVNLNDLGRSVVLADKSASSPSITPDGNKMVFQMTGGGIYSMNIDGTDLIPLSTSGSEPRLSPDGKLIAYSAYSSETMDTELYLMNIDGTGQTNITGKMDTATLHNHNIFPEWSPDGKYIVFHSDNAANPSTSGDIWKVGLNDITNLKPGNTSEFTLLFQIGANMGQNLMVDLIDARTTALGIDRVSVLRREDAEKAIRIIDSASQKISTERSRFGVHQNVLEHIENNVSNYHESILSSESRIRDLDIASETAKLASNQIILQSAQAMMAQANQVSQGILQMLR